PILTVCCASATVAASSARARLTSPIRSVCIDLLPPGFGGLVILRDARGAGLAGDCHGQTVTRSSPEARNGPVWDNFVEGVQGCSRGGMVPRLTAAPTQSFCLRAS